ncbi:MAG: histidine kinase [Burkholderiales bacterium]|nr:histidine kinase [Burkholderiales bacterium]
MMRKNLLISTLSSLFYNTAIAGLLTAVSFGGSFAVNFVFSQCIGISIQAVNALVAWKVPDRRWLALSFPASVILGVTLGASLTGLGDWSDPRIRVAAVIGLFFGGIGGLTYFLSERIEKLDAEVKERKLRQSEIERREIEARLKLLQAQIEPHFLFNTLANVGGLIDSDPALARRLLDRLNDWLRVALARSRSERTTLGDELDMLENYLEIMKVRFGERLSWEIDAGESAREAKFPPMLLQPLVENAVRHGIEPKLGGGRLRLSARRTGGRLSVSVRDDGPGMGENPDGNGLANVKARLAAIYGEAGRLILESDEGAVATLEVPA